jgi:predicted Rdx family selenoprotein
MGGFGVLDVLVDGRVVFSKKAEGRIPPTAEIVARVRAAR